MSRTARLLTALAPRAGVGVTLFRFQRAALLGLFSEYSVLEVSDLGVLENNLLLQRLDLDFPPGMLGLPIACPTGKVDVLLLRNRDSLLRKGGRLPFIRAGARSLSPRSRAEIGRAFHGAICTLFFFLCPVHSSRCDGLAEYLPSRGKTNSQRRHSHNSSVSVGLRLQ